MRTTESRWCICIRAAWIEDDYYVVCRTCARTDYIHERWCPVVARAKAQSATDSARGYKDRSADERGVLAQPDASGSEVQPNAKRRKFLRSGPGRSQEPPRLEGGGAPHGNPV